MPEITDPALLQQLNSGPTQRPRAQVGTILRDPYAASREARAERSDARAAAAADRAADAAARAAQNDAIRLQMEAMRIQMAKDAAEREVAKASKPPLTAAERVNALTAYRSAQNLRARIAEMEKLNDAGAGATRGLAGLLDYLPTQANRGLDSAGNTVRGDIARALGFTGGQLNSVAEAEMNVGPYIPQARDYDDVRLQKIQRLKELADSAEQGAIMILGGRPDEAGNITPIADVQTPTANQGTGISPAAAPDAGAVAPQSPNGFQPGGSQQQFFTEVDRAYQKAIQDAFASGASIADLNSISEQYGRPLTGKYLDAVQEAIRQRDADLSNPITRNRSFEVEPSGSQNTGLTGQIFGGMANSPLGSYFIGAGDALTFGGLDELSGAMGGAPGVTQVAKDVAAESNPLSTLAGNVTGAALATYGLGRGVSAIPQIGTRAATAGGGIVPDMLYGAGYGAGSNNENRLLGAVTGAGAAGVGNVVGRGMFGGLGRVARGVRDPAVNYLRGRGIPLTIGQMVGNSGRTGQAVRAIEDALTSVPFLGPAINAQRREGVEGFNRAAFRDALSPIDMQAPNTIGNEAIEQAQNALSQHYDDTLAGVRLNVTPGARDRIDNALKLGDLVPNMGPDIRYSVDRALANVGDDGVLTGRGFQAATSNLRRDAKGLTRKDPLRGHDAADALGIVEDTLNNLAREQAPGVREGLAAGNRAYGNLSTLEDAVNASLNQEGVFTPAQLGMAARSNTKRFAGKKAAARGDIPFAELQRYAQDVLPSTIPDSGTAGRAWASMVLPSAIGGAAIAGNQADILPTSAAIPLGMFGLASTRVGRKALEKALLDRPAQMVRVGDMMVNRAALGGRLGALLATGQSQ